MDENKIAHAKIMAENKALLTRNRELEALNKELSLFTYMASHDLQEPLRKIHTFIKMIADDDNSQISADGALYIDRVLVSTLRMQRLIEDLLSYGHVGELNGSKLEEADLNVIVTDILTDFTDVIKSSCARVNVAKLPTIKLIPPLVYQVFLNVVGNALKYRNTIEPPVINISYEIVNYTAPTDEGTGHSPNYAKITVSDNGIGFPQEQATRIFEPFQRLHGKDTYEGTGIGLAICKKIMITHKGHITVESSPGNGSKFNLFFPV